MATTTQQGELLMLRVLLLVMMHVLVVCMCWCYALMLCKQYPHNPRSTPAP